MQQAVLIHQISWKLLEESILSLILFYPLDIFHSCVRGLPPQAILTVYIHIHVIYMPTLALPNDLNEDFN